MSLVITRRWLASVRLIALVAVAALLMAALAPAALAQEEPASTEETAAEETETATALNPNDDRRGGNPLNPMAGGAGRSLNPNVKPNSSTAADGAVDAPAAETEEPAADDADAAVTEAEQAADDDEGEGAGTGDRPAVQAGERNHPAAGNQPVTVEQATGGGESAPDAGAGGASEAGGDGGTIIQSALISGNNRGTEVYVEDCAYGSVQIDGGTIVNATDISLSANGGTAVSTANGGDDGVVRAGGAVASRLISAGNGGDADSEANGGTIITGAMITGNNRGHEVNFADCPGGRGDALLTIDTGDISNTTSIDISANGGTAVSDANGGNGNLVSGGLGDGAAGNGGSASSAANGGTVITGAMITGNNRGNTITVGRPADDAAAGGGGEAGVGVGAGSCAGGPVTVVIDGGDVSNSTSLDISADGGTAIGDASGGDGNTGIGGGAVGNGGDADASANGGAIITNAMITGNNRGNSISVGNVVGCAPAASTTGDATGHAAPQMMAAAPAPAAAPKPVTGGGKASGVTVLTLPNTGTGQTAGITATTPLLVGAMLGLLGGVLIAHRRSRMTRLRSSR